MNTDALRKKHPRLTYKSFEIELRGSDLTIISNFVLAPDIAFSPQVIIRGVSKKILETIPQTELNFYAFNLGMAEVFSYWKCAIPPEIIVETGHLSRGQIDFWQDLLIKGMGEFFFVNQIDFTTPNFVKISAQDSSNQNPLLGEKQLTKVSSSSQLTDTLIPLGGGKDSLVTLELLKEQLKSSKSSASPQDKITLFALNPNQVIERILKLNPELPVITASRKIDLKLLELNQKGYLNGHTPFSSYLAFLTSFVARLFKIKYIAISNERSSNEQSAIYKNHPINHQYSKSYDFEKSFQGHIIANLGTNQPFYFSFLRPLYELQIAQIFTKKDLYFKQFKSCNKNQKLGSWCQNCSKCLFAFLILYPFLNEERMTDIFTINLFSNQSLWNTTLELIGYADHKPLECVGTHEESLIALFLSYQKVKQANKRLSTILENFEKEVLPKEKNLPERAKEILQGWNTEHSLPPQFAKVLQNAVEFK